MSSLSRTPANAAHAVTQAETMPSFTYLIVVPLGDRWRIHQRLQELMIPCWCLPDGSLRADVQHSLAALLLRSVVQQFVASRQERVNWLDRCWDANSNSVR